MKGAHIAFAVLSGMALLEQKTPQSYRAALDSEDAAEWLAAMKKEFDGCVGQDTWELVPRSSLPPGTNVIPVKWVFKIKTDENGKITKFKARITPKGFKQKHGVDFFEIFANTGKYKSLRTLLSIAAKRRHGAAPAGCASGIHTGGARRRQCTWKCRQGSKYQAWCVA